MRDRVSVSSSGPFLIELLIGLAVFALAAAICVQVFVGAQQISKESSNLNHAMIRAQSGAEVFKASHGDLVEIAEIFGVAFEPGNLAAHGAYRPDELRKHFDSKWQEIIYFVPEQHVNFRAIEFVLTIRRHPPQNGYISGEIIVNDISGNTIFALEVATLEVTP